MELLQNEEMFSYTCAVPPAIAKQQNLPITTVTVPHGVAWPLQEPRTETIPIGSNVMIPEGYHLIIECGLRRGNPKPSIVWHFGDNIIHGQQYIVEEDGKLLINAIVRGRNEGVYTCIADTDSVGQDNSSSTVIVTGKSVLSIRISVAHVIPLQSLQESTVQS